MLPVAILRLWSLTSWNITRLHWFFALPLGNNKSSLDRGDSAALSDCDLLSAKNMDDLETHSKISEVVLMTCIRAI